MKQWIIPFDAESYIALRNLGVATTRIHSESLDTLVSLLFKPKGVRGSYVDFNEGVLNPFLDRVGASWNSYTHASCKLTAKRLVFETEHKSVLTKMKGKVQDLEACLDRFFTRWGYSYVPTYSESRGKLRYQVEFGISQSRMPVIAIDPKDENVKKPMVLDLGYTRIEFFPDPEPITPRPSAKPGEAVYKAKPKGYIQTLKVNIYTQTGSDYKLVHTSRCLMSEVTGVNSMLTMLLQAAAAEHEKPPTE